jgi:hypothetical protein
MVRDAFARADEIHIAEVEVQEDPVEVPLAWMTSCTNVVNHYMRGVKEPGHCNYLLSSMLL